MKKFFQDLGSIYGKFWKKQADIIKNETWARLYWLGAIFILLAIFLWKSGHLFEARLGITLAVVEIPIIVFGAIVANFILRESLQREKEFAKGMSKAEGMKGHKKDLLEMLSIHATNGGMNWSYARLDRFYWNSGNLKLPYLLSHLREYDDVFRLYEMTKKFSDEQCDKIEKLISKFEEYVNNKLESFTEIPSKDNPNPSESAFMKKMLMRYLLISTYHNLNKSNVWKWEIVSDKRLQFGGNDIAYGSLQSLKKLLLLIHSLESDANISSFIVEIIKLDYMLQNDTLIVEFNEKRNTLKIEHEHKDFKGKCDACPESI